MREFLEETYNLMKNTFWFSVFRITRIQKNKVVICNYYGKDFGDNPKYIALELNEKYPDLDVVWLLNNKNKQNEIPNGIRKVKYNSIKGIYEMATAKVWIDNCRKLKGESKRRKQYYIQTWHGLGPKQCERDVESKLSRSYVRGAKRDSKMADVFVSSARFLTELYKRAFWYDGEVLEVGYPRNDIFVKKESQEMKKKICEYFSIPESKKILIYAPTFRNSHSVDCYNINFKECKATLEKRFGGEWVILFRLHPNMTEKNKLFKFDNVQFIDASNYFDAQELLAGSDALISDYSSILVDFLNTSRPTFIYAPDIRDYEGERNFYFDLNEMPAAISQNNEELVKNILEFQESEYIHKLNKFNEKMGIVEPGTASEKIAKLIASIIEKDCNV